MFTDTQVIERQVLYLTKAKQSLTNVAT